MILRSALHLRRPSGQTTSSVSSTGPTMREVELLMHADASGLATILEVHASAIDPAHFRPRADASGLLVWGGRIWEDGRTWAGEFRRLDVAEVLLIADGKDPFNLDSK